MFLKQSLTMWLMAKDCHKFKKDKMINSSKRRKAQTVDEMPATHSYKMHIRWHFHSVLACLFMTVANQQTTTKWKKNKMNDLNSATSHEQQAHKILHTVRLTIINTASNTVAQEKFPRDLLKLPLGRLLHCAPKNRQSQSNFQNYCYKLLSTACLHRQKYNDYISIWSWIS